MTQFLNRVVYPVTLYAGLVAIAILLGLHLPARSQEGNAVSPQPSWSPRLTVKDLGTFTRPQSLGAFTSEQACEEWSQTPEAKAEFAMVLHMVGADDAGVDCVANKPAGTPI